jgi:hypothetical protein
MNYEPALEVARREIAIASENETLYGVRENVVAIVPIQTLKDLALGVEALLRLEEAIVRSGISDDAQNDISDEYRMLTGEAEHCESCGVIDKGEHYEDCDEIARRDSLNALPIYVPSDSSGEKVSSCCSVPDRPMGEDGPSFEDVGLCPNCREHCEFEVEDDE